jgi:predicted permease
VVIGLLPAWKVAQHHLIEAIKDGGQNVSRSLDRALLRRVMVAAQVAGSCVLLIVAGMMVRSVQRVLSSDLGFDYERAAVLSVPLDRYGLSGEAARAYWQAVKERALVNPEVEQAAIVTAPPLGERVYQTIYDDVPRLAIYSQMVDPEFFDTMKIPLLAGRVFQAGEAGATIVGRRLALEMYGTMEVLGLGFPKHDPKSTIVGVAADAHAIKVNATNAAEVYVPLAVDDFSEVYLVARARGNVERLPAILRQAASSADRRVIPTAHTLRQDFDRQLSGPRVAGALAVAVGGLTLLLACLGIFGVVSYGVALRTKEIGIRVALGASPPALLRSIVRQVLTPVVVGMVAGLAAAIASGRALSNEPLYLEHVDPLAIVGALAIFMAAGAIAALWPAARALRGNPVDALRHS